MSLKKKKKGPDSIDSTPTEPQGPDHLSIGDSTPTGVEGPSRPSTGDATYTGMRADTTPTGVEGPTRPPAWDTTPTAMEGPTRPSTVDSTLTGVEGPTRPPAWDTTPTAMEGPSRPSTGDATYTGMRADTTPTGVEGPTRSSTVDTISTDLEGSTVGVEGPSRPSQEPKRAAPPKRDIPSQVARGISKARVIAVSSIIIGVLVVGFIIIPALIPTDTTAPVVEITTPSGPGPYSGLIRIEATIIEENLDSVQVFVNGTLISSSIPCSWLSDPSDNGFNNITVRATDQSGLVGWDSIMISVLN